MAERTFMVLDREGHPIARSMDLKTALILVEGLFNTYYKEIQGWTIIPDATCITDKEDDF